MKKYGFIYIWFDRKHKRYYIGSHWGTEDDGYICSSSWMKKAYNHRSKDFKRRILARVYTTRKELLDEEHRWLLMIDAHELGKHYYNLTQYHNGHWTSNPDTLKKVGDKISRHHLNDPNFGKWNIGKTKTEEMRAKLRMYVGAKASMYGKRGKDHPMYGRRWYNNGMISKHLIPGTQPEGWSKGRALRILT